MFRIFIDASIYRHENFNLKNRMFSSIIQGVEQGNIVVLTTVVTEAELKRRISELVDEASKASRKFGVTEPIDDLFQKVRLTQYDSVLKDRIYDNYVKTICPTTIPIEKEDVADVYGLYAIQDSPFEPDNKKKSEISDALIFKALERAIEDEDSVIYVCSQDGDFRGYFDDNSSVKIFDSLSRMLDEYFRISSLKSHDGAVEAVKRFEHDIKKSILEYVSDTSHFEVDDFETEIEDAVARNIEIEEIKITGIEEGWSSVVLEFRAVVDVSVSTEAIVKDPVDGDDVSLGSNSNTIEEKVSGTCLVTLIFDNQSGDYSESVTEEIKVFTAMINIPEEFRQPFQHDNDDDNYDDDDDDDE